MHDARIELIFSAMRSCASYLNEYAPPAASDLALPSYIDADRTHFSDDDLDYLPAAADMIALCADLITSHFDRPDDTPDPLDTFLDAILTCSPHPLIDAHLSTECLHMTALECDISMLPHPSYDDCPHLAD